MMMSDIKNATDDGSEHADTYYDPTTTDTLTTKTTTTTWPWPKIFGSC